MSVDEHLDRIAEGLELGHAIAQTEESAASLASLQAVRDEIGRLEGALERIALGTSGRLDSGLLPGEGEDYLPTQPKTDWALARAALGASR